MNQSVQFDDAAENLIELLHAEKTVLLAGQLDQLADITQQKSAYMDIIDAQLKTGRIEYNSLQHANLSRITALAKANETLLASAKAGVNSAKLRLEKIKDRESSVGTYTETGAKLGVPDSTVTRRKLA